MHVPDGAEVEVVETDRGGRSTYHGPGQLVCYPILDLKLHGKDVKRYCRDLEEAIIRTVAAFGVEATRIEGLTGVWVTGRCRGRSRRSASTSRAGSRRTATRSTSTSTRRRSRSGSRRAASRTRRSPRSRGSSAGRSRSTRCGRRRATRSPRSSSSSSRSCRATSPGSGRSRCTASSRLADPFRQRRAGVGRRARRRGSAATRPGRPTAAWPGSRSRRAASTSSRADVARARAPLSWARAISCWHEREQLGLRVGHVRLDAAEAVPKSARSRARTSRRVPDERRERRAGVGLLERGGREHDELVEPLADDRRDQRVLRREAAEDRAVADAGAACDLVDAHVRRRARRRPPPPRRARGRGCAARRRGARHAVTAIGTGCRLGLDPRDVALRAAARA